MHGNSRRLDVCLGDFAISIQGYDEPLAVLEEVLRIGQRVLAETPDLLNSEAVFDEATMTEVIERVARRTGADPDALGAVPGIVLVHRQDETDGGIASVRRAAAAAAAADGLDTEAASAGADWDGAAPDDAAGTQPRRADGDAAEHVPDWEATAPGDMDEDATPDEGDHAHPGEEDEAERVVNIFGGPAPEPAAPGTGRRPLFGARTAPAGAAGSPATPAAAAEGAGAATPRAPERQAPGGVGLGDRFESLLAKVHGRAAEPAPAPVAAAAARPAERMSPAEVAAAAGAEDAQDALLSAAAFLTVIRRQSRFTRRELLAVFDAIPGDFPRTLEIQIKGIGKLIRNGALRRVDDDHFGLSRELIEKFEPLLRP